MATPSRAEPTGLDRVATALREQWAETAASLHAVLADYAGAKAEAEALRGHARTALAMCNERDAQIEALRVALLATRYHAWHAGCRGYLGDVFFARIDTALAQPPALAEGPQPAGPATCGTERSGELVECGRPTNHLGGCSGPLVEPAEPLEPKFEHTHAETYAEAMREFATTAPPPGPQHHSGVVPAAGQPGTSGNRNEEEGR